MTFESSQPDDHSALDDRSPARCLRYLLGELDTAEAVTFEQELSHSSDLSDELLKQADLLCHLSASKSDPCVEPAVPDRRQTLVKAALTIAALAACLAIMVGRFLAVDGGRVVADAKSDVPASIAGDDINVTEASLIASAWASGRIENVVGEDELATQDFEFELVSKTEDLVSEDSAFSWMVHAIAADTDSSIEAATSDG